MNQRADKITWDAIGQCVWGVLHSFVYSVEDSRRGTLQDRLDAYFGLVVSIQRLYPCLTCFENLNDTTVHRKCVDECGSICGRPTYAREASTSGKIDAESACNALALWAFRLHNSVSRWKMMNYDNASDPQCQAWLEMESRYMSENAVLCKLREQYCPQ